ncbi:MAG TPA: hypothetical protein VMM56_10445 [Planctomycetaceae bacterium]|nr:hypothetical protein [Planctomycetaceae bacterium]
MKPQVSSLNWMTDLVRAVLDEILPIDTLSPIGCHYFFNQETEQHEVTLFASKTEIIGGADDGQRHDSRFCLDLSGVSKLFDQIVDFRWQTSPASEEDDLGGHVSCEGEYQGISVWLRILASAPAHFDHGRTINVNTFEVEDLWDQTSGESV